MEWELDHVFLACSDVEAAKRAVADSGIVLDEGRTHQGQGTANVCAYFVTTTHRGAKRVLTRVRIQHPEKWQPSASVRWFAESGPLSLDAGSEYQLELIWGNGETGCSEIAKLHR